MLPKEKKEIACKIARTNTTFFTAYLGDTNDEYPELKKNFNSYVVAQTQIATAFYQRKNDNFYKMLDLLFQCRDV